MKRIAAIARRDFSSFFFSPRGYLFLGLAVCVWGFYFLNLLGRYNFLISRAVGMQLRQDLEIPTLQQFVIGAYFQLTLASFAVLIPLLAMRAFAEERQTGTLELLLTSPVSIREIVLGKFFGLVSIVLCFVVLAILFPFALVLLGSPDRGALYGGMIGLGLCGISFSGLCLACSAGSTRQLSAAVSGVSICTALLLLHTPAAILPSTVREALELASTFVEASAFFDGYISAQGIVYFLVVAILGLLAANYFLQPSLDTAGTAGQRPSSVVRTYGASIAVVLLLGGASLSAVVNDILWWPAVLQMTIGGFLIATVLLQHDRILCSIAALLLPAIRFSIAIALVVIAARSNLVWDVSDGHSFTISPHTRAVLARLDGPVEIRYVLRGNTIEDTRALRFLGQFASANSDRLKVTSIDPLDYVDLYSTFGIRQGSVAQLVTIGGIEGRSYQFPRLEESSISAAFVALANPVPQKIYVWEVAGAARLGDGGPHGLSKFAASLRFEGLAPQALPESASEIPSDASVVLIAGPRESPSTAALEALEKYLSSGGRVLLCLDPLHGELFSPLLQRYGIEPMPGVLVDHDQAGFSRGRSGLQPLITTLSEHPITNRLGFSRAVIMNTVMSFRTADSASSDITTEELLFSSAGSYVELDAVGAMSGKITFSTAARNDQRPSVAFAISQHNKPVMALFGDSDWMLNSAVDYYSNRDLALNSVQWLSENSWALQARSTSKFSASVALSGASLTKFTIATILLAQGLVLLGILVCARRTEQNP